MEINTEKEDVLFVLELWRLRIHILLKTSFDFNFSSLKKIHLSFRSDVNKQSGV